ncbi:MAG: DUF4358 domain-containing protein [Clostridiales bacterium]|nr:DUF4358 domain-containing protein [Clostridiales bacterium]
MIKRTLAVLMIISSLAFLAACTSEAKTETKYSAKEIMDRVRSSMTDLGDLKETDRSSEDWNLIFAYVSDIEADKVKNIDYLYMTNSTADELCVVILSDEDSAKKVESDMKHRIEVQKNYFASYNTEELSKLDAACAERSGNVCIMLIGNQAQNGKYEFDKMMSE